MKNILLVGATGYLGSYILSELISQGYSVTVLLRDVKKISPEMMKKINKIVISDLTDREKIRLAMNDIDTIISTLGITRQKDGFSYMDVDFGMNNRILEEAKKSGVRKFIYVSVLHAQKLKHLKICEAKECFVNALQNSGIEYSIIRPSGFFSDMEEFISMAKSGKVYLFKNGEYKANPIDGSDLSKVCVDTINTNEKEIELGGPEVLTHNQIAHKAFEVVGKKPKIVYVPLWVNKIALKALYWFTGEKIYGPIEFFLHVMAMDMYTRKTGIKKIEEHFKETFLAEKLNTIEEKEGFYTI